MDKPVYDINEVYKVLKELNVIPEKTLDDIFRDSQIQGVNFTEVLVEKDLISDENLGRVIARTLALPFVKLSTTPINSELFFALPEEFVRRHKILLFEFKKGQIGLASYKFPDKKVLEFIEKKFGQELVLHYSTLHDLEYVFTYYQRDLQQVFDQSLKKKSLSKVKADETEGTIITLVNKMVEYAYSSRSSDIHIEPQKDKTIVRFRIDGALHQVVSFNSEYQSKFISRIKYLAKLRTDEHLSPQDGKFQIQLEEEELDIRVSIVPVIYGEKCVMRLLAVRYRQFGLSDLGLTEKDLNRLKKSFNKPYGMVLSTGPTGSGKTTTMYAILKIINTSEKNIATIEDPVEYDIAGINQIQVNQKTNLTFASGLRSILRQDPNIIFVGEIRDTDTADIAINSSLTGHLVLSTLHTNDAATTLPRLLEMNVEPYLVASTVNVIVAQRLIRKICEKCRVSYTYKPSELKNLVPPEMVKKLTGRKTELRFYKGKGCSVCRFSGYLGRVGIFEVLEMSPQIRKLVINKEDASTIKQQALKEGMTTMFEDGFEKILQGITTIEELLHATHE